MDKYQISRVLGEGTYGTVSSAINTTSGYAVAIKTLKDRCPSVSAMSRMPEVRALQFLTHPNIVNCLESILDGGKVHLVFELMDGGDLEAFCRTAPSAQRKSLFLLISGAILRALSYMHVEGFLHRDVKPENVLLSGMRAGVPSPDGLCVKIADLGLAREIVVDRRDGKGARPLTAYVATRWYRAPEQLMRMASYGAAADMWSVGATIAEILSKGKPLFPGDDEEETLREVFRLRGHPEAVRWEAGMSAADRMLPGVRKNGPVSLEGRLGGASKEVVRLVEGLLRVDPRKRWTAERALRSGLFDEGEKENDVVFCDTPLSSRNSYASDERQKRRKTENRDRGERRRDDEILPVSRGEETTVLGQSSLLGGLDSTPTKRRAGEIAQTQSLNDSQNHSRELVREKVVAQSNPQEDMHFFNLPVDPTIDLTGEDDDEQSSSRGPAKFFNLPSVAEPPRRRSPFKQRNGRKQAFSISISPPEEKKRENRRKRGR